MFQPLTSSHQIGRAEDALRAIFRTGADVIGDRGIGYPSGQTQGGVYWHETDGIWGCLDEAPNERDPARYWNAFGIESPARHSLLSITCEVNPPKQGTDRRRAGLFARDPGNDAILLLHSGRIGGGKPSVGKKLFWDNFNGAALCVQNDQRNKGAKYAVVAELGKSDVVAQVARFVYEVKRIKALA